MDNEKIILEIADVISDHYVNKRKGCAIDVAKKVIHRLSEFGLAVVEVCSACKASGVFRIKDGTHKNSTMPCPGCDGKGFIA